MAWLIGAFILFILLFLIIVLFVFKRAKRSESPLELSKEKEITLDALIQIVKREKSEISRVEEALDRVVKGFPFPRDENKANEHFKFVYFYAKNPLTTAKMIVKMQHRLSEANPQYAKQIENFQMIGVEARNK